MIGWPARIAHLLCVFLLALNELSNLDISRETVIKAAICIFLYGIAAYHDGPMSDPAMLFVFVFCGRNISFEKIVKTSLYASCILLAFIIVSGYAGIITNYVENYDGRRREYLGFLYSLYPAAHMSNITSLIAYLKRKSIDWKIVLILVIANIFIFVITNIKTFLCTLNSDTLFGIGISICSKVIEK